MRIRRLFLSLILVSLVVAPSAVAGGPGKWTLISPNDLDNIDQVALSRTPDGGLHAIYALKNAHDIVHTPIAANGTAGTTTPVTQGWATISYVPDLVTQPDGSLRAFFGGIHSTDTNDPNNEFNTATAPGVGAPWSLFPGPIAKGDAGYGSDAGVALQADGTPIISWGSTGSGTFIHRGLDPSTPNFPVKSPSGLCCTYEPEVAVDPNGTVYVAFFSNATGDEGLWIQQLDPATGAPVGSPAHVPGSSITYNGANATVQQLWRTQIAARVGGGVWVAGSSGYPTATKPFVWKIGTTKQIAIGVTKGSDAITAIAADPSGRIWVFWIDRNSGSPKVFARRSSANNPAKFGAAVALGAPPKMDSSYSLEGNAQSGRLDVVGLFGNASGIGHWHTQANPGLGIAVSPSKVNGNKKTALKFTITDPDPVKGAKVSGGGDSATTNSGGQATLDIGPTSKKSVTITVNKAGYTTAKRKLKVTH